MKGDTTTSIQIEKYKVVKEFIASKDVSLRDYINKLISNDIKESYNEHFIKKYFKT